MKKQNSVIFPLLLIFFGFVFLLITFNVLPSTIWSMVWRYWPALLIVWGLEIIFGRTWVGRLFVTLLGLAAIAFILVTLAAPVSPSLRRWLNEEAPWFPVRGSKTYINKSTGTQKITVGGSRSESVSRRNFDLDIGVADFHLTESESTNHLNLVANTGGVDAPRITSRQNNGILDVKVDIGEGSHFSSRSEEGNYEIGIGQPDLETSVALKVGVGKGKVEFSKLFLKKVDLNVGVGEADVFLEGKSIPSEKVNIEVGVGAVKLNLPQTVGLKINHHIGLGSLKVDNISLHGEGAYTSANYDSAPLKLEIDARVETGSIEIFQKN
jgi:hypothetical protein